MISNGKMTKVSVIPTLLVIAIEKMVKVMQYFQSFANSN
jgi:hypothetical protein